MSWLVNLLSSFFSAKNKNYKGKVEKLREILDELEKGTVSIIRVESDQELLDRAKDYLKRFKGQRVYALNTSLLPAIERLVNEICKIRDVWWFRLLTRYNFKF